MSALRGWWPDKERPWWHPKRLTSYKFTRYFDMKAGRFTDDPNRSPEMPETIEPSWTNDSTPPTRAAWELDKSVFGDARIVWRSGDGFSLPADTLSLAEAEHVAELLAGVVQWVHEHLTLDGRR